MEGFKNIKRAQVHSLGTSGMMKCAMNVHENVPGFNCRLTPLAIWISLSAGS